MPASVVDSAIQEPPACRARPAFMHDGGELGAIIRAYDWENSTLGAPQFWPQSLKTAVRFMLSSGHPMFIWWGPDLIQFYNDAYRQSIGPERHPSAIGQRGRECWDEIWHLIGWQIEQVMAGGDPTWHENQLVPITRNGRLEEVYWTYSYNPIDDPSASNGVGGVLVVCAETTRQVLAEQTRAAEAARWQNLFEQAPSFICIARGPEHVFEFVNAAHRKLFNSGSWVGKPVREAFPDIADQGYYEHLDRVYSTGERIVFNAQPIRYRTSPDRPVEVRFCDFIYAPIIEDDGSIGGIFCEGFDVTEQKRADEHLRLMVNELNHRVKNSLAIVQGIAAQTLRQAEIPADVRDVLSSRLVALAKAHDVLTDAKWAGASLAELAQQAVEPYAGGGSTERFVIEGPALDLPPRSAIAVALALHELTTNAVKYGALSSPKGAVHIGWRISEDEAGGRRLLLRWAERGGPPVVKPSRKGFGTRMIERSLAAEFDGRATIDYRPGGVVCLIDAGIEPRH